jgi:hypothetical protein
MVEMLQALSRTPSAWLSIFVCPSVSAGHTIGIERTCGALTAQDQAEILPLPVQINSGSVVEPEAPSCRIVP